MKKFIRGKVINISDEYTLILNIGAADGVEEGMIFDVYEEGELIFDADGRSLGLIEYPKAKLKIINVSSDFSIAESDEWYYDYPWDYEPDYDPGEEYLRRRSIAKIEEQKEKQKKERKKIVEEELSLSEKIRKRKRKRQLVIVGDLVRSKKAIIKS